ncbi:MAG: hypothetical protein KKF54_05910 [Candidatus Omnitrophica bacterium]|nr:hypothetical protein [Candidatus Omnitrophota bacterium]
MSCIFRKGQGRIVFQIIIVCFFLLGLVLPLGGLVAGQQVSSQSISSFAKISLDVKGMDIIDVLKILSDEGGFNLSIGGNVSGRVTLFLKDIDVWDALEIVLVSGNLAYEKKGQIIYIMTERDYELKNGEKYWDKRKVEIFNLKYAQAGRVKELLAQVASNIGKVIMDAPTNTVVVTDTSEKLNQMRELVKKIDTALDTQVFELNYLAAEDLSQKLTDVLTSEVGNVRFDVASNKVVITDYPDKMAEIRNVIKAFDVKPLQVLIDAKIIELNPSKNFYAGINWEYWIQKYFKTTGTFNFPYTTTTDKVTFSSHDTITTSAPGDYSAIIDFLSTFGNTKVLSTPRILVLNNQEAKILVGTKEAYITSTTSEVGDTAVTSQSVNFVDVGVKLYVTPTINRDGYVTLKIRPEISSAESSQITSEDQKTDIPIVTTSEAETTMIVKEGVSVLLGGLRKITHDKQHKQIPILGNIPIIGNIFKSSKDEWTKDELVIVLTPRIVSGDRSIEEEIHDKLAGEIWEKEAISEFEKEEKNMPKQLREMDADTSKIVKKEIRVDGSREVNISKKVSSRDRLLSEGETKVKLSKDGIEDLNRQLSELDDKLRRITREEAIIELKIDEASVDFSQNIDVQSQGIEDEMVARQGFIEEAPLSVSEGEAQVKKKPQAVK